MKRFTKSLMNKAVVAGVTRHALTAAGGWLIAEGYATSGQVELMTGGAVALVGVLWSANQKRKKISA
jgi:phage/plasmid primase-like uncharacterized protein